MSESTMPSSERSTERQFANGQTRKQFVVGVQHAEKKIYWSEEEQGFVDLVSQASVYESAAEAVRVFLQTNADLLERIV